ncbi:MAG TPA: DUF421 domain-containing protein [Thermoclostridium caenicola]|nr:DUF421 domain-containing protein [Thermoclostridium caenicola]HOK42125.1 DUF421 domain-containing protein [Thermoclostridium caenicola]HOL84005.1 DUF421 domain-containing protein [Thermoclostridium caenicola]HPO75587.1 DUF421 domain-containing protein [Thermoclostridium caenicola]HPU21598.1 DUF421 domain-containing protein [Thermoclostridium caenicola]
MLPLIWKTLLLYIVIIVSMRLMGKRQIGQLQPFEFAVAVMISELAALPLTEDDRKLHHALIPIAVLVTCQLLISYISIKGVRIRGYICGKPTVVIRNGRMLEKTMRKEMCTINELLEQLRFHSVQNVSDVEYAILETNGQLSVILKSQKRPVTPEDLKIETKYEGCTIDLIIDGILMEETMKKMNIDKNWLDQQLKERGISDYRMVFYAAVDTSGNLYVQKKGEYLE